MAYSPFNITNHILQSEEDCYDYFFFKSALKCVKWQFSLYFYIKCTCVLRWPLKQSDGRFSLNFANVL